MKHIFLILLTAFSVLGYSQNIFEYEKEINNKEKYNFQEINYQNTQENFELSGTLITPKTDFDKIIIIVSGSGKDTRYAHFILAEELLKNGIAVYRFDERGVGKSKGNYSELVTTLSTDLGFAFKKMQTLYKNIKIGVIGHSIGGISTLELIEEKIIPDFVVLLETPVIKNGDFVYYQIEMDYENRIPQIMRKGKTKQEFLTFLKGYMSILATNSTSSLKKEVKEYIKKSGFSKKYIVLLDDVFLSEMSKINLETTLKETAVKTLYLTGTKDHVINQEKEINLVDSFKNPNIEIKSFTGLNHYLTDKNGKIGSSLYQMDKEPLDFIINWLVKK